MQDQDGHSSQVLEGASWATRSAEQEELGLQDWPKESKYS